MEKVEVPAKFKSIVEAVESMTVLDLNELVKLLEKKFGVSAVAAVAATPVATASAEESSTVALHLASAGAQKIAVIKVIKEALGLGLGEAKAMVDGAPILVKDAMKKDEADVLKKKIEEAGGKVEYK
ncbi:MAG TPA: 50S ribosomal protein L7/L12 [Candidatus Paceibacterota bacterium]